MILEVCVDSVYSALQAQQGGADRIELCQDLSLGGTTPSYGLIVQTLKKISLPVMGMIRPRSGDFCYDEEEFSCMLEDIQIMRNLGVRGIVTGILTEEGEIDKTRMRRLMEEARGLDLTFHRAFDMTKDLFAALADLEELGIKRVLTSGAAAGAEEGSDTLKLLLAENREISIMAGCGVNVQNARSLADLGIKELHFSGRVSRPSPMRCRNLSASMGRSSSESEYLLEETSAEKVASLRKIFPKETACS